MLKANGFDEAVLGIGRRCGQEDILVYDFEKCVDVLVKRKGMTDEEAIEFLEFNTVGAWVGEQTPLFLYKTTLEEIKDYAMP
jgi:hypothetical protein